MSPDYDAIWLSIYLYWIHERKKTHREAILHADSKVSWMRALHAAMGPTR